MTESASSSTNFLRDLIESDLAAGKYDRVVTRFPPEPNGYLHIGHAKSICANFGLAAQFGGICTLRMDDTNPTKEDIEYVESIQDDIRWLGFDWGEHFFHAADYFEQLYAYACELIGKDLAYVCGQTNEAMRRDRGTVTQAGTPSPDRDRPPAESLELFARMRAGEFADGELTLRAKIDMAASNMKLRDPPMYRIRHATHHRTGDDWPIYPMYDFAHGLSDSIEGITHSFCTLEFQNNRALYDWYIENCSTPRPRPYQHEFARLELSWTLTSKRKLLKLVSDGHVEGWDDPRMPTVSGLRRRGVPPAAVRNFCERIGVAKTNSVIEMDVFDDEVRAELNRTAARRMAVLDPVRLVLTDWSDGTVDRLELANHPSDESFGTRTVPLAGHVFVERSDFSDAPPKGWKRLAVGTEIRLRGAYLVTVHDVLRDEDGRILELHATHDPASRGGDAPDGRKVRGTIHWVPAETSVPLTLRMVDRLFRVPNPGGGDADFLDELNPDSMPAIDAVGEGALRGATVGDAFQFERIGYFAVDAASAPEALVLNRAASLRAAWARASVAPTKARTRGPVAAPSPSGPSKEERAALASWTAVGVSIETARMLKAEPTLDALAWDAVLAGADVKEAANLVANELVRALEGRAPDALPFGGAEVAALASLTADGTVNQNGLRTVLGELLRSGGSPAEIVAREGLAQLSSDALTPVIAAVLADHPDEATRLGAGERKLVGFLLGQVMRRTGGKADPKVARELLMSGLQSDAGS